MASWDGHFAICSGSISSRRRSRPRLPLPVRQGRPRSPPPITSVTVISPIEPLIEPPKADIVMLVDGQPLKSGADQDAI